MSPPGEARGRSGCALGPGIIESTARIAGIACTLAAVAAIGCGSDRTTRGEGTLDVVVTTTPLADIVHNAGGRRVLVTSLVPQGADPHRWRLRPGQVAVVRSADLVVRSGGSVDAWAAGIDAKRRLELMPQLDPIGRDPHWWQDPVRVEQAAKLIRNELARADVHGAGYYEAATADFLARLRRLDHQITRCLGPAGSSRQRLTTPHPGFAYFSARYGVEFVSPRRATVGRRLWADTLGPPGSPAASYLGAMSENTATIVDALSGGRRYCRPRA